MPYRNSKLTRVLKDSLDEASNVALIICISPSVESYKETLSTLQFADRAKRAVLDGRHPILSPAPNSIAHSLHTGNRNISTPDLIMSNIVRAYEEEKAIRIGLQQYHHQVIEEME